MTFQAYIDAVHSKTGKSPEELKALMERAGLYKPNMTATELVTWLKQEFGLGHGHAMAIWAYFKSKYWVKAPK